MNIQFDRHSGWTPVSVQGGQVEQQCYQLVDVNRGVQAIKRSWSRMHLSSEEPGLITHIDSLLTKGTRISINGRKVRIIHTETISGVSSVINTELSYRELRTIFSKKICQSGNNTRKWQGHRDLQRNELRGCWAGEYWGTIQYPISLHYTHPHCFYALHRPNNLEHECICVIGLDKSVSSDACETLMEKFYFPVPEKRQPCEWFKRFKLLVSVDLEVFRNSTIFSNRFEMIRHCYPKLEESAVLEKMESDGELLLIIENPSKALYRSNANYKANVDLLLRTPSSLLSCTLDNLIDTTVKPLKYIEVYGRNCDETYKRIRNSLADQREPSDEMLALSSRLYSCIINSPSLHQIAVNPYLLDILIKIATSQKHTFSETLTAVDFFNAYITSVGIDENVFSELFKFAFGMVSTFIHDNPTARLAAEKKYDDFIQEQGLDPKFWRSRPVIFMCFAKRVSELFIADSSFISNLINVYANSHLFLYAWDFVIDDLILKNAKKILLEAVLGLDRLYKKSPSLPLLGLISQSLERLQEEEKLTEEYAGLFAQKLLSVCQSSNNEDKENFLFAFQHQGSVINTQISRDMIIRCYELDRKTIDRLICQTGLFLRELIELVGQKHLNSTASTTDMTFYNTSDSIYKFSARSEEITINMLDQIAKTSKKEAAALSEILHFSGVKTEATLCKLVRLLETNDKIQEKRMLKFSESWGHGDRKFRSYKVTEMCLDMLSADPKRYKFAFLLISLFGVETSRLRQVILEKLNSQERHWQDKAVMVIYWLGIRSEIIQLRIIDLIRELKTPGSMQQAFDKTPPVSGRVLYAFLDLVSLKSLKVQDILMGVFHKRGISFEATKYLIEKMKGDCLTTKRNAASLLKFSANVPEVVESLIGATKDSEPSVRRYAVIALGGINPTSTRIMDAIALLLNDPDKHCSELASSTLDMVRKIAGIT